MLDQTIKTRGLHVTLRFAPTANFDKDHRRKFQMRASEGFDWGRHEYADRVWRLVSPQAEGDPRSHLKLTLEPEQLHFEDVFPIAPVDVFIDNLKMACECTEDVFGTKIMLGSRMIIRLTAEAPGGDARIYLGNRCLGLEHRLTPLGRPIHAVGLKMFLPALANDQPPWQAEVKVESLVEDVRQLFIEVDAQCGVPAPWNQDEVTRRLRQTYEFANKQVIEFLKGFDSGSN